MPDHRGRLENVNRTPDPMAPPERMFRDLGDALRESDYGDAALDFSGIVAGVAGAGARRGRGPGKTPEMKEKIAELYRSGASRQEIADYLGVGLGTAKKYIQKNRDVLGLPDTSPGFHSTARILDPEAKAKFAEMYNSGRTLQEIADALGMRRNTVQVVASRDREELGLLPYSPNHPNPNSPGWGEPGPRPLRSWPEDKVRQLFEKASENIPISELARQFDTTPEVLKTFLRSYAKNPRYGDLDRLAIEEMATNVGTDFFPPHNALTKTRR